MTSPTRPTNVSIAPASRRPARRGGRHLRAVVADRRPAVPVLVATGIVLLSLFGLAVMHAMLIQGQVVLDTREVAIAQQGEEIETMRLRVAELEAPDRVLTVASERLGMLPATEIGYVLPVGAAPDDDLVRSAPAEVPVVEVPEIIGDGTASAGPVDPSVDGTASAADSAVSDASPQSDDADASAGDAPVADVPGEDVNAEVVGG